MKLYHTSPEPIESIRPDGTYGRFLCFGSEPGLGLSIVAESIVYAIEIDSELVPAASHLRYIEDAHIVCADEIAEAAEMIGCDEDVAWDAITSQRHENDCDVVISSKTFRETTIGWELQRLAGECAVRLGFLGAHHDDECCTCYVIDATRVEMRVIDGE